VSQEVREKKGEEGKKNRNQKKKKRLLDRK
jgi:hypothetical protein